MHNLRSAAREVTRRYEQALRPVGLTGGQFSILAALSQAEEPALGQLAEALAMDRTTLTRNLRPLEARGLVAMRMGRKDARLRVLGLTEAGRDLFEQAIPPWERAQAESLARLGPDAWPALRASIRSLG